MSTSRVFDLQWCRVEFTSLSSDGYVGFTRDKSEIGGVREWLVPSSIRSSSNARAWIRRQIKQDAMIRTVKVLAKD
ncbi:MAG: hypothetical protein HQL31_13775 [Planctomycetes bacterium]|nr:hypothetical protein [Planctomycetota bacterium]